MEEVKKNSEEIIEIQSNIKRDIIIARKHAENGSDQEGGLSQLNVLNIDQTFTLTHLAHYC